MLARSATFARTAGTLAISALLLTGCSLLGGDDDEQEPTNRLTINEVMGGPDYESVDYKEQERQIQESIAVCMDAEGWQYIPVEYPDYGDGGVEYTDEDEVERIKREGFGIAYWILNQGTDDPAIDDPFAEWEDPNTDYVAGLSQEEQTAYYESLYGTEAEQAETMTTEVDPETGEEYQVSYGWGAGCQGEAYDEVYGDDPTQSPDYWEAVQEFYDELQQRVEADPRVVELNEKWSACMKDADLDYETQQDFYDYVYTELQGKADAILGDDYYADPLEGWTQEEIDEFFANATQEEMDELWAPKPLTDDQRTQLEALLAEEIDLALAEHSCSKDLNEKMGDLYSQIEEEYALEHEDELKQLAASLASGE